MKKLILLFILIPFLSFSQNVRILPDADTVCYGTSLSAYIYIPGNSFQPVSYTWSIGGSPSPTNPYTGATLAITQSGLYEVEVIGYVGNSGRLRTYLLSRYYHVLDKPRLNFIKGPWVCRFDTVKVTADPGYTSYTWYNGTTGSSFSKIMNSIYGSPSLDTAKIFYTARINNVCEVSSRDTVIRGVRANSGAGQFYCGKLDINPNDSIPAGLVLEYLFPNQYEMVFTQVSNLNNVITYFPPLNSRKAPASLLTPGEQYYVDSRVIINGQPFCWGNTCIVRVKPPVRIGEFPIVNAVKEYRIFTIEGRLINTYKSEFFNKEWMESQSPGIYIIQEFYQSNVVSFKYHK